MQDSVDILYIEDNDDNRAVMAALLEKSMGIGIDSVTTAEEGLARCEDKLPDVILMDIRLPGMGGIAAINQLKQQKRTRHIPVIAVSAYAMKHNIDEAMSAGAIEYITKPFRLDQVITAIQKVLH